MLVRFRPAHFSRNSPEQRHLRRDGTRYPSNDSSCPLDRPRTAPRHDRSRIGRLPFDDHSRHPSELSTSFRYHCYVVTVKSSGFVEATRSPPGVGTQLTLERPAVRCTERNDVPSVPAVHLRFCRVTRHGTKKNRHRMWGTVSAVSGRRRQFPVSVSVPLAVVVPVPSPSPFEVPVGVGGGVISSPSPAGTMRYTSPGSSSRRPVRLAST